MRIVQDLKQYANKNMGKGIVTVITNPCFHSVCLYRLSNILHRCHLNVLAKLVWYINRIVFNVDIDYRADLAGGFCLVHGLGVVIGSGVKSEGNLRVYQGVTIGGSPGRRGIYEGKEISQPVLCSNVILYTDAKVFGPVVIGKNNIIKAGSIITKDMEDKVEA